MIVYNTATSGTAGVGSTQGTLSPGFWYYENKSATNTGGTWKPLGSISAEVDGVIGNEVTNATASGGLTRAGSGTAAAPYTLGIADNGVTAARIAANAVTNAKIAAGAVDSAKIASNAIKTVHINANAVTSAKIADATIVAADIANATITGAKLANTTITATQLADGAVTSAKILDGTIATADLADNSITSGKIVDGTIVAADIAASTITGSKLAAATITSTQLASQSVTSSNLAPNSVTSAHLSDGSVQTADIADGAVTAGKLSSMGAVSGHALVYNGTQWAPAAMSGTVGIPGGGNYVVLTRAAGESFVYDSRYIYRLLYCGEGAGPVNSVRYTGFYINTGNVCYGWSDGLPAALCTLSTACTAVYQTF
jgi:hypothetical protein